MDLSDQYIPLLSIAFFLAISALGYPFGDSPNIPAVVWILSSFGYAVIIELFLIEIEKRNPGSIYNKRYLAKLKKGKIPFAE